MATITKLYTLQMFFLNKIITASYIYVMNMSKKSLKIQPIPISKKAKIKNKGRVIVIQEQNTGLSNYIYSK